MFRATLALAGSSHSRHSRRTLALTKPNTVWESTAGACCKRYTGRLSLLQRSESKELKQENLSRCAQKNSFGALQQQVSIRSGAFRSRYIIYVGTRHRVLSPLLSAGRGPLLTLRLLEPAPHKDEVFCTPSAAPERCAMAAPMIRRLVVARIMALVGVLIKAQAGLLLDRKKAGDHGHKLAGVFVRFIVPHIPAGPRMPDVFFSPSPLPSSAHIFFFSGRSP